MADDRMYLENLKEFVIDEERIVTYKWLSRTLSVNVNQAKQMLYAFIKQQQEEKADSLCIIYTVGGLIKDKDGNLIQKYLFSHEKDLPDIKQCYDSITSLHVYSIQKMQPKDSNILYLVDYDLQKQNLDSPNRWSNIACKSITRRTTEIQETVVINQSKSEEKVAQPISNGVHKPDQNKGKAQSTSTSSMAKSSSIKNSKAKSTMKKGDVASFFARQAASKNKETVQSNNVMHAGKDEEEQEKKGKDREEQEKKGKDREEQEKKGKDEEKHEKKDKDVTEKEQERSDTTSIHVETNENEKTVAKNEKDLKDVKTKEKEDKRKTEVVELPEEEESDKKKSSSNRSDKKSRKTQKQNKNEAENQQGKDVKSKKRKTSKEKSEDFDEKPKLGRKKRKRVKNFSDTSSEEEDNSVTATKQSSSGTDNPSIPDQQLPDAVTSETQKVRRRKRVLKSKTYLNDDGYMVTEKIYESESATSEDDEKKAEASTKVDSNKPVVKNAVQPPKKKPANKATKQASLTSFFKRT